MALRPISTALLKANPMRMGIALGVLLHLHGNDVAGSQLADRIQAPKIRHSGLRAISNHFGTTRTGSEMNLIGSRIDPLHGPHDFAPGRLTRTGGKIVSAHQRS